MNGRVLFSLFLTVCRRERGRSRRAISDGLVSNYLERLLTFACQCSMAYGFRWIDVKTLHIHRPFPEFMACCCDSNILISPNKDGRELYLTQAGHSLPPKTELGEPSVHYQMCTMQVLHGQQYSKIM
jgi:hypothetical protein